MQKDKEKRTEGYEHLHIVSRGRGVRIAELLVRVGVRSNIQSESIDSESLGTLKVCVVGRSSYSSVIARNRVLLPAYLDGVCIGIAPVDTCTVEQSGRDDISRPDGNSESKGVCCLCLGGGGISL